MTARSAFPASFARHGLAATLLLAVGIACERPAEEQTFEIDRAPPGDTARMMAGTPEAEAGVMIHAMLSEWRIDLTRDTVPSGAITIMAVNNGRYVHALEIEGAGRTLKIDKIEPGGSAALTTNLDPGTYEVYCPVRDQHGDHQALGMRTTLVVR
jgi:uncharacterized cupredoxin-like copper-binding protein